MRKTITVTPETLKALKDNQEKEVKPVRIIKTEVDIHGFKGNKGAGLIIPLTETVTFEMSDGSEMEFISSYPKSCRSFIHPDLVAAIGMLKAHLAFLAELPESKGFDSIPSLEEEREEDDKGGMNVSPLDRIFIDEVEWDSLGVKIKGHKLLRRGKLMPLPAPQLKYHEDAGVKPYDHADELQHVITHLTEELNLYMKGKVAPSAQGSLDFPDQEDDSEGIED